MKDTRFLWSAGIKGTETATIPKGKNAWPFKFRVPKEIEVPGVPEPRENRLPPTLTQLGTPIFVDYRLHVVVERGRFHVNKECVSPSLHRRWVIEADEKSIG